MTHNTSNVDPGEIDKFSRIAHKWWDKEGEFKPLHDINPLRLQFIRSHADLGGKKVLDVGCGGGILTEALAAHAAHVTGIDMAEKSLKIARLHALEGGLDNIAYRLVSVEALAEEMPEAFDVVTCMEMLEHVPDPAAIVRACARLAKPGGTLFFSTINRNPKAYAQAIVAAEYLLKLTPRGTHDYQKFITPAELARLCRQSGLSWAAAGGFTYNPLTRQYRLCYSIDVNYMMACTKPE